MTHLTRSRPGSRRPQTGLTLIEFMVSIVIGMLMIAALATLIANQSSTRSEIEKSGRMIENGRYSINTMVTDVQLAGYWGELSIQPATPGTLPDPCTVAVADLQAAMGVHVQGYNAPATLPSDVAACVKEHKPGTDVLVVRRVDPDTSAMETAGATDLSKVDEGQVYLQTGLDVLGISVTSLVATGSGDGATNTATFILTKKNKVSRAVLRKMVVDIYYVSKCSVPVGTSCTAGDNGNPIPTLKRVQLGVSGNAPAFTTITIAEGVENFQVDYGVDTDSDGSPNGADVDGSALTVADWPNVVTVKLHVLARGSETSGGFTDGKTYAMGTAGEVTPASGELAYKRHAFVQSVRLVNPSSRRVL
ncbi:MAG: pilus assembly protein PilW [Ramlibacter sp.]|nr:pilus assembly protein PilW [Ramlibacter sp.]